MASLREIAREYKDEIMSGIAWVAIWKTGRSWNARAFWLNPDAEKIECEEMEEARAIVAADERDSVTIYRTKERRNDSSRHKGI